MKTLFRRVSLGVLAVLGLAFVSCSQRQETTVQSVDSTFHFVQDLDGSAASAVNFGRQLGLGWNLGNSFDSFVEEVAGESMWNNDSVTQQAIDSVKACGFHSIRIPITWLGHVGPGPEYKIEPAYLERVAEVVNYAKQDSLYTIINIHHDGADAIHWLNLRDAATDAGVNDTIVARYTAMWRQIANRFKDESNYLIFEAVNEIHDGGWGWGGNMSDGGRQYDLLNSWMQHFVNTVRATGGRNETRYLSVAGYCQDAERTVANLVLPKDPTPNRLLVTVHFFAPAQFTLQGELRQWGHTADPMKSVDWCTENYVNMVFDLLYNTYVAKGIPVYVGETGCSHRDNPKDEEFCKYYLEYVFKCAADRGISAFYWDNGGANVGYEASGLLNHSTGEVLGNARDIIDVLNRACYDYDPSYTLKTVYEKAPRCY